MKQIAIYLRLSLADSDLGEDGKEESNSIENQRLLARNFLESHEEIVGEVVEYKDDGYSGMNFDRPGFRQMIEDARKGLIGTIIVKDLSRFGRDYIGVGDYLEQILPSLGVRLIAINSKYDSQEQGANILSIDVSISNMINSMYSKDLSKKLRSSFRAKWNDGQNPSGGAPFGYSVIKGDKEHRLSIDEEAAEIVRTIFKLAVKGLSSKQIAEKLNAEGFPTPLIYRIQKGTAVMPKNIRNADEQLWNTHKVLSVIKNYDYTGARVHGKVESIIVGGNMTKRMPKASHIIVENDHPAIVSKEMYEDAQCIINTKSPPKGWNKNTDAFSRKLRCGCCGASLQILQSNPGIMYCQHSEDIGSKSKCNKDIYDRGKIISSVLYAIRKNIEELSGVKEALIEQSKTKFADYEQSVINSEQELKALSDDLARQYENYVNGNLARDKFLEMKKELTDKRMRIETSMKEAEHEKGKSESFAFELNRTVKAGNVFFTRNSKISEEAIDTFLDEVYVYSQDRIEVKLKTTDLYERALSEVEKTKALAIDS